MVYLHWAATSENSSANGRSAHTSSACLRRGHFAPSFQYKMTLEIPTCVPVEHPREIRGFSTIGARVPLLQPRAYDGCPWRRPPVGGA